MSSPDVSLAMMQAALQMRALGEWMMVNHEKIAPETALFFACYMTAVSKYAATVMDPRRPTGRCIFY